MYSKIYESLVKNENDVLGQVAYSLYKSFKIKYIERKKRELNVQELPPELIEDFIDMQTDRTLEMYRNEARRLSRNFINEMTNEAVEIEKSKIKDYYLEKFSSLKPNFWYGVAQSIAGSFIFLLMGWVILKLSGIWEILINKLML